MSAKACPVCTLVFEDEGFKEACSQPCRRQLAATGLSDAKAALGSLWWRMQDDRARIRNAIDAVIQAERTMLAADTFVDAARPRARGLYGALARSCRMRLDKVRVRP